VCMDSAAVIYKWREVISDNSDVSLLFVARDLSEIRRRKTRRKKNEKKAESLPPLRDRRRETEEEKIPTK